MNRADARELLDEGLASGAIQQHPVACGDCGASMTLLADWDEHSSLALFYGCSRYPECRSTHGAHSDGRPLGVPGDAETRAARIKAHESFDRLWRGAAQMYPDLPETPTEKVAAIRRLENVARSRAYAWLADRLRLPVAECHIGKMDATTCELVEALCRTVGPFEVRAWAKSRQTPKRGADAVTLGEWGEQRDRQGREW